MTTTSNTLQTPEVIGQTQEAPKIAYKIPIGLNFRVLEKIK